jgi:para-nitrobenzyl esterase
MRKGLIMSALLPLASACSAVTAPSAMPALPGPTSSVQIESGAIEGVPGEAPGVLVFKGIPYAAPPVGPLRWRPPQPPRAWSGVRSGATFSKSCVQELRRSLLPWTEEYMLRNDVDEDCLALNIWVPASAVGNPRERLPVFVYLHGGAFSSGSGEVLVYDGEGLAKKGVIVVTLNYRLGLFGFFCHPELRQESPQQACGNYGLLDQLSALGWVQRNIAAFGGDPANITLGGQSAGAAAVQLLGTSPLAHGLFQRAIAQSGAWDRRAHIPSREEAEQEGVRFAGAGGVAALRALSAAELLSRHVASGQRFRPIVDGWVVPDQPAASLVRGAVADVPLLTGLTADERSSQPGYGKLSHEQWLEFVRADYGDIADAVLTLYPAATDSEAGERQKQLLRDTGLTTLLEHRRARAQHASSKGFGYFFERAIPWPEHPEYQAFHSAELPYMFNNLNKLKRPWQPEDHALAELMSSYWVNFMKNGDPNGPGLPEWPSDSEQVMRLGSEPAAEPEPEPERAELLVKRPAPRR